MNEQPTIEDLVTAALTDVGLSPDRETVCALADALKAISSVQSCRLAAQILFSRLPESPAGEAIFRYLTSDATSLRDAAKRIGCHATSISRADKKLLQFLGVDIGKRDNKRKPKKGRRRTAAQHRHVTINHV